MTTARASARAVIAANTLEADFQSDVLDLCRTYGVLAYHTHDSRRSQPGWPDLAIVGTRLLLRELKTETGKVTPEQMRWLLALEAAGVDAAVWRPSDWPERIRAELSAIRPGNGRP